MIQLAQFRSTIRGTRGEASRLGSKSSGMIANVNGWNAIDAAVRAHHDDGVDVFEIRQTGGSGYSGVNRHIATIRDGVLCFVALDAIGKVDA